MDSERSRSILSRMDGVRWSNPDPKDTWAEGETGRMYSFGDVSVRLEQGSQTERNDVRREDVFELKEVG